MKSLHVKYRQYLVPVGTFFIRLMAIFCENLLSDPDQRKLLMRIWILPINSDEDVSGSATHIVSI